MANHAPLIIRGLSLTQPWASLVALGVKQIETRSWGTNYRGLVAIHASKGFPLREHELLTTEPFASCLQRGGIKTIHDLPLGAIVAVAQLTKVQPMVDADNTGDDRGYYYRGESDQWDRAPLSQQENSFGVYGADRFAWHLSSVLRLPTPIPCKGSLGLWKVPADVLAQIEAFVLRPKEAAHV